MAKCDFLAFRSFDLCRNYTCKILSKIINHHSAWCLCHRNRMKHLMCFYWCSILCHNLRLKLHLFLRCLMPGNLFHINRCVVNFAIIKLCLFDCSIKCYIPALISSNDFFRTILIGNPKFAQKCLTVCIVSVHSLICKGSDCPAASNNCNQLVFHSFCAFQLFCYIICLILQLVFIRSKSRCKINISYFLTV